MPLTLVTGPANAAKAGYVLERLREVLHREPLLVVPTSARRRALPARARGRRRRVRRRGADLRAAGAGARPRGRSWRAAARPGGPRAGRAGGDRRCAAARARAVGRRAGVRPRGGRAVRRAAALAGRARALHARACGRGAARRTPTSWPRCTPRTAGGSRGSERPDREGEAWAALDALRADPAAWGRRPVFLYGFDELTRASWTRSRRCRGCARPTCG